jgi:IS30 family transposase
MIAEASGGFIRRYRRLNIEERKEISLMMSMGSSFLDIARSLDRHVSTISREVCKGSVNRWIYRAIRAGKRGRKAGKRRLFLDGRLEGLVQAKLLLRWSPEQIAQWLKQAYPHDPRMQVSRETIYTYLYVWPRGQLKQELLKA